jgi:hypothetical protein
MVFFSFVFGGKTVQMIDFSKGGYQGDGIEELFKEFTAREMPYWWHFREVLRASHLPNPHWVRKDTGEPLYAEDASDLVSISLMMYHVYTCLAEAISFFEQLNFELNRTSPHLTRFFEVKKNWKAAYSSLYSSYIAYCNLLVVVVGKKPLQKNGRNYHAGDTKDLFEKREDLQNILDSCKPHLVIRHHLDHFWLIWMSVWKGKFSIDGDFSKGYVRTSLPPPDFKNWIDGQARLKEDILEIANNFNLLFLELSKGGGYLDQYLASNDWQIDYSDYGPPHYRQRPNP